MKTKDIIKGLMACVDEERVDLTCQDCPYRGSRNCSDELMKDALKKLKEYEERISASTPEWAGY